MKVHVFDTYVTIKDREGHPDMDDTLLEKLDEMLTTYSVPHAFSLPHEKTMEDCPEAVLEVAYAKTKSAARCFEHITMYALPYALRVMSVTFGTVVSL